MVKWKALLDNAPENATHVDLIFSHQMQRGIDWIGGRSKEHFYRKSINGEWYRYDVHKGKYFGSKNMVQGTFAIWRLLRSEPSGDSNYIVSLDTVRIMVKQFEGEGNAPTNTK